MNFYLTLWKSFIINLNKPTVSALNGTILKTTFTSKTKSHVNKNFYQHRTSLNIFGLFV